MAVLFASDCEEEEFIGFTIEPGFERDNRESECEISVSSVDTEDLSDLDVSDQESGHEYEQEWNKDPGPVVVNQFIANTGLVRDVRGYSTLNVSNLMFKDSNFDRIAEETNRYVQPDPAWRETNTKEVKAFFAFNILVGIKQLPKVYSYWSKNQLLGVPEVQKIFLRNCFAKISQYLHLNDKRKELPRGHANHDKLFKVPPLLDSIVEAVKSKYRPSKNVLIDDAMIPFKEDFPENNICC